MSMSEIVKSQVFTMTNSKIIVPTRSVAEVIQFTEITPMENMPLWVYGTIVWRKLSVPIISLETMETKVSVGYGESPKLIILNSTSHKHDYDYFGVIANALPKMVEANAENIKFSVSSPVLPPYSMASTTVTLDTEKFDCHIINIPYVEANSLVHKES